MSTACPWGALALAQREASPLACSGVPLLANAPQLQLLPERQPQVDIFKQTNVVLQGAHTSGSITTLSALELPDAFVSEDCIQV